MREYQVDEKIVKEFNRDYVEKLRAEAEEKKQYKKKGKEYNNNKYKPFWF